MLPGISKSWLLGVVLLSLVLAGSPFAEMCSPLELQHDVRNCGSCGNACTAGTQNSNWSCDQGTCTFVLCEAGFYDADGDDSCEYACSFRPVQEICNEFGDDCDGLIDESFLNLGSAKLCGQVENS